MLGDKSQTMDSDAKSPKKLRKILPRPRATQLVVLNQANAKNLNVKERPKLRVVMQKNTPPPLSTNTAQNKISSPSQSLPKIVPLNTSLPPLAVINQQGMKVNVVKAVWVPSSPGQPHETASTTASKAHAASTAKPKDPKVIILHDDNELCCRLCGKTFGSKGSLIDVFGADGQSAQLQEKVQQCIPISITKSDKLPSTICQECVCVLELSFKLVLTALKTDQELRKKLNQQPDIGGAKRTNVKTTQKSNQPVLGTSLDDISGQRGRKAGPSSLDHTYMTRSSTGHATDPHEGNETAANVGQSPDNGSLDSTECNLCGKMFNDIESFLKHVESDHISDPAPVAVKKRKAVHLRTDKADEDDVLSEISLMNCFKCKEICLDDEDLQFHLNYECVVCDVCGLNNRSRRAYVLHLKKHHEVTFEDIQRGTDKIANKKDATKNDGNSQSNGGEGTVVIDSIGDDSMGGDHFGLGSVGGNSSDGAAENGGSEDKEHSCSVCHKVFRNRLNFDKHQKLHDPLGLERDRDSGTFKCDVCPRSYHRHDNLLKHKRLNHSDGRKYACTFCEAKFVNPKDKSDHEKQQHSVSRSEIDGVDPTKPETPKSKENRLWICGHCGKALSSKLSLVEHERIHTGFKPFSCEECGQSFRTKANLFQHSVVHTGDKRFSCPICEKVFSRQSFVKQHIRSHTGEKPFACDVCGQRFSQVGDLNRHKKRHKGETTESVAKKRKLADEISTDDVNDTQDIQLAESVRLSSSSDIADTSDIASDIASDVDAMDMIACEVCSKEFQDLTDLREHRFVEHGQEFQEVERAEIVSEDTLEEEMVYEDTLEEEIVYEDTLEEEIVYEDTLKEEMVLEDSLEEREVEEVKEYVLVVPS